MYHQSLSFPYSQTNSLLQRWFFCALPLASHLCHFLIPSRCHVSSHHLLMYPNASDSNKGRTDEPFEVCERALLFQACLRPAGGHFPLKSSRAAKGFAPFTALVRVTACLTASPTMESEFLSLFPSLLLVGLWLSWLVRGKDRSLANVFHSNRIHEEFRLHNAASQREGGSEDSVSQGRALYC